MKGPAKKTGHAPVIDPYLPGSGNFGYRVSRYDLDLEYKVASNRLSGTATITAATLASLRTFTLDIADALSVGKVAVNGRRPAAFSTSGGKLRIRLSETLPAGSAMTITVRYGGSPRPIESIWGTVGFEELTNGALVAGQRLFISRHQAAGNTAEVVVDQRIAYHRPAFHVAGVGQTGLLDQGPAVVINLKGKTMGMGH